MADWSCVSLDASFLRTLLENKLNGGRTAANSRAPTRPGSPSASGGANGIYVNNLGSSSSAAAANGLNSVSAGLESFLKSRAPSLGPEGQYSLGMSGLGGMGGEFGASMGLPAELGISGFGELGGNGVPAFDSLMADDLSANGFWSSMLMVRLLLTPVASEVLMIVHCSLASVTAQAQC